MNGKCVKQKNILVLCRHAGVLLKYSALLNDVGYFRIGLCSSIKEVKRTLATTQQIDCFIVDGFKIGTADEQHIRTLSHGCLIKRFLLLGDFTFADQPKIFAWARTHHIQLLGMLRQPVNAGELERYLRVL
ncbi:MULTISPECIES: hypothetical protein [Pseudomonas]|uniref:Uncharacterized protein n=1 Tax=Pseudomonas orientalis TaxID=76758 RepID=A0A4V2DY68_9PSED|nr:MULTISPECIES: hypothetical protein [Pseudomonas]RZI33010.1 hypothetical protein EUX57_04205 [Pseudomonas orientalis]CRN01562.1 hypothetical protein [Pseudomonas sp. 34 E 7]